VIPAESGSEGLDHGGRVLVERDAMGTIEQPLPKNQPGAHRTDDRRVISGIVHVLRASEFRREVQPPGFPEGARYSFSPSRLCPLETEQKAGFGMGSPTFC
jgi:hypothetical protein